MVSFAPQTGDPSRPPSEAGVTRWFVRTAGPLNVSIMSPFHTRKQNFMKLHKGEVSALSELYGGPESPTHCSLRKYRQTQHKLRNIFTNLTTHVQQLYNLKKVMNMSHHKHFSFSKTTSG